MSFNTFGKFFRFTTWGESHGPAIGCIIDGCPPLIELKEQDIQKELDKRKPGQSKFTTQRKEDDKVEILSGLFNGVTQFTTHHKSAPKRTFGQQESILIGACSKMNNKAFEYIRNVDYDYRLQYGAMTWATHEDNSSNMV